MASTRDLILRFQADTADLKAGTASARKNVSTMAGNVEKSSKKAGGGFRKGIGMMAGAVSKIAGPLAAVFAVDKIKDFAVESVKAASDLNETISKSQQIFGKQAGGMEKWAEGGAKAFGLSKEAALGAAAGFGDMFSQIGFTGKEAAKSSKDVVQMAADLGSFNNLETGEVLDMISASMRGEYDSLQRVIPNINAARVEKEALAATGKKNAKALTAEEKAQATLAIIQKDGARAQGDFARTSGGLANQQKILKAQFDNLKATLGQALLPIVTKVAQALNAVLGPATEAVAKGVEKLFGWFKQMKSGGGGAGTTLTKIADAAKALWDAISPIIKQIGGKLFEAIKKNLPEIQKAIGPAIEAVKGYLEMLAAAYTKIAGVIKKVWQVIGPTVLTILGGLIKAIAGILSGAIKIISGILNIIVGIFTGDFSRIKKGVGQILQGLLKIVKSVLGLLLTVIKAIFGPMVKWVVGKISELKKKITTLFQNLLAWVRTTWKAGWAKIKQFFTAPVIWAATKLAGLIKKIREIFTKVKSWMSSTWRRGWSKIREYFTVPISKAREKLQAIIGKIKAGLGAIRDWAGSKFKAGWAKLQGWIMAPVNKAKKALQGMFGRGGTVRTIFNRFIDGVGTIFGKMKAAIGKPLNKVIGFINKGLIRGGINKILGALGVPKKNQVPWISPVSYERGGPVTGGSPWQRSGRDRYPAYLDDQEHVLTRGEVRKLGGHRRILQWRKAVRQGKAYDYPGLAGGGSVRPVPGGFGSFPSYPGHTGVDFPVGMNTPVHAVMAGVIKSVRALTYSYGRHIIQTLPNGMEALYAHLNNFATTSGARVGAGQVIGYSDSTGNSTGPHLHFTLQHPGGNYVDPTGFLNSGSLPGGDTGGGIGGAITDILGFLKGLSPVKWLTNKATALRDEITKMIGNNPWAAGLARLPGFLINKAKDFMTDKLFGGIGGGEPAGSGVERWRSTIISALRLNNLPTSSDYVEAWLRQVKSESGGNPKAVQNGYVDVNTISGDLAKGLLQTISATFNAYKFPGHGDIFNGFDNALAAINYAKNRYGSSMLGVIGHGHGYDSGGWLPPGLTLAMNNTGRPEPILTGQQWDALTAGSQEPAVVINVNGALDPDAVARQVISLLEQYQRRRGGPNLISRSRKIVRAAT